MAYRREAGQRSCLFLVLCTLTVAGVLASGCKRKHVPVTSAPELPYPTCADGVVGAGASATSLDAGPAEDVGRVVASGRLRGSPDSMAESDSVETFELRDHGCLTTATVRQEWKNGATDVEVVFNAKLVPLRAWRRMTLPTSKRADGNADIRRYELRTEEVTLKRKAGDAPPAFEILRGNRPTAVIGPGRGLLTAWIRRSHLEVGEKVRESVLDFREMFEVIRDVTLKRESDRFDAGLGKTVRVYTIYGREAVFTDDTDAVVGDLAGLRPADTVHTPEPQRISSFGVADPVHTP